MAFRLTSWLARPLALRSLLPKVRLVARLWREPRVPVIYKVIPVLALLYLISPIDAIPDFIPGLGQLDDLGVVLLAMELFLRLCPPAAQAFHHDALAHSRPFAPMSAEDDVIEAEWRHG